MSGLIRVHFFSDFRNNSANANCGRLNILQHILVSEPYHSVTLAFQKLLTGAIRFINRMVIATIHFNNQVLFEAKKVHNEWADGLLSTEFQAIQSPVSQHCPKQLLRFGARLPKLAAMGL